MNNRLPLAGIGYGLLAYLIWGFFPRRGVLVEDMGQTYLAEPDADGEEARTLRPLQAAAMPCRPRLASGQALRQAQTVHWTVCVRAQPTESPSGRAPGRRC